MTACQQRRSVGGMRVFLAFVAIAMVSGCAGDPSTSIPPKPDHNFVVMRVGPAPPHTITVVNVTTASDAVALRGRVVDPPKRTTAIAGNLEPSTYRVAVYQERCEARDACVLPPGSEERCSGQVKVRQDAAVTRITIRAHRDGRCALATTTLGLV